MALLNEQIPQQNGLLASLSNPLLTIGAGLLANSGYSTTPVSLGQALGSSMANAQQQTSNNEYKQALMTQMKAKLAEQQRQTQAQEAFKQLNAGLLSKQITPEEYKAKAAGLLADMGDTKTAMGLLMGDGGSEYGQPIAAVGADGKLQYIVTNKAGQVKTVDGFAPVPKKGTQIVTDGAGGFTFEQGGDDLGGGAMGTTTKTTNELQGDITSSLNSLKNLDLIAKDFNRSYLTYAGQLRAAGGNILNKALGSSVDKEFRQGMTKFKNGVEQMFNQYRKEITGAAASVQELDRLKQSMLNADMSPDEFEAAYSQFSNIIKTSLQLKQQLLTQGVPVGEVGKMVDATIFGGQAPALGQAAQPQPANAPINNDPLGIR